MAREIKDSGIKWMGTIPVDWEISPVFKYFHDKIFLNLDYEFRYAFKFNYGTLKYKNELGDIDFYRNTYLKYIKVKKNDIIINGLNLNYDFVSQRVAITPQNGIITSAYIAMRPYGEQNTNYFCYLFKSMDNIKLFHGMGKGIRLTLSFDELKRKRICVPRLPEQKAIADFLDKKCAEIDGLLADLEAEVKTLAEYKKSIIAETVTRGLNPNAPMKQSGIPWAETIPAHWVSEKFRYKLKVRRVTGQGDKQVLSVYREYCVVPKDSRDDNHNVTSEDTSKYKYVRPNDFVINKMKAWQGSMGVSDYEGIVSPAYFVYGFSDDDYNPRYFHYFMRNANNIPEYRRLSGGIREGQWDLSPYDLGNMPVIVPPKAEQNEIVAYLDEKCALLDKSITDKQTQIETLKSYRSSLIYEYVTGKKRVI